MTATAASPGDLPNVQGLITRGYRHPYSTHMLFHYPSRSAAAKFTAALLPHLQASVDWGTDRPAMMLNVSITFNGMKVAAPLTANDLQQFPNTFQMGPESVGSQQSLYDLGTSAPASWWGQQFNTADLHCIVHAYAADAASMETMLTTIVNAATDAGVKELFGTADGKTRFTQVQLPDGQIHFGFRDGISEPPLGWPVASDPGNSGTLNNFLIGYPGSAFDPGPSGNNAAGAFAKDGCYNAFRVIAQDVNAFEAFLDANAAAVVSATGLSTADAREWLAAKLIGRWRNGSPLELSPDKPEDSTRDGELFGYSGDPQGMKCPYSAHTRVANPRDETLFTGEGPVPRIIRRGVPYGAPVDVDPNADRGLIGVFLVGALAGQFELLYGWMNINNFMDAYDLTSQDAIVSNNLVPNADGTFVIPTPKGPLTLTMPTFLTTRGTAYCLVPSIASMKAIATQH
jgi:deferrochelatase/peroxidase EfeB